MKKSPKSSKPASLAPRNKVAARKPPEPPSPGDGSKDNLIGEAPPSPPYRGHENPVFTFDSVSLFSRAPSRVSEIAPAFDIPFRGLPPTRRGSYFTFLPGESRQNLVVPTGSGAETGQRRSSFATSNLRDSVLASAATLLGRPRAVASLSIDDIPGHEQRSIRSPGLLSTASMWSTTDLRRSLGVLNKPEMDTVSHVGTASLSNVSGSFSERMHELVRAFSSRTKRVKEKISQPPTPSSDSDCDAKSVNSETDEKKAPRKARLGSFMPAGSQASDADDNHEHLVGVWRCKFKTPKIFKKIKLPATVEPHSKYYVSWLFLVSLAFLYNAVVIPLRGVFPYQTSENVRYWLIIDYVCDVIYVLDILTFKCRLRFANNGVIETDQKETKKNYLKKLMFKFDVMSLTPLDFFYFLDGVGVNPWLRLPRVLKIQTYWEFYERCDQASRSSAHAIRIIKAVTYMLFLIHIEACGYYAMSVYEGIGVNEWVYSGEGIAYIRCFYLATKTATSIGNNPTPKNKLEYIFMTFYWLSGVFVFALLIGQIRDIVEAATMVKDNYRKKMDSCLWYMQSINLPKEMKDRVREWFNYNWEQQKTIDERSLVCALPKKLQTDLAINVHFNTLSKVQLFQDCERNLLYDLVLKLKPILYLPGDYICKKGEVGREMYIVTQGQVEVVGGENGLTVLATLYEGSVFGEISLLAMSGRGNRRTADVRSKGYTNVFTLSKHDFEMAMTEYPDAQALLKRRAKRLLKANAKMEEEKKKLILGAEEIIRTPPETPKLVQTVIKIMDPDSNFVKRLTPSLRSSHRNLSSHSRSHSHRLSTSSSNIHHLAPQRSHSFRLSSQPSDSPLNPSLGHDQPDVPQMKDGFDTDEDNDGSMYDDSSDDVSLSEVLHDALTLSSFDDDDGDDEHEVQQMLNERYGPHLKHTVGSGQSPQRCSDSQGSRKITWLEKQAREKENGETGEKCTQNGRNNGSILETSKKDGGNLGSESHDKHKNGRSDDQEVQGNLNGSITNKTSKNNGNISSSSMQDKAEAVHHGNVGDKDAQGRHCESLNGNTGKAVHNNDSLDAATIGQTERLENKCAAIPDRLENQSGAIPDRLESQSAISDRLESQGAAQSSGDRSTIGNMATKRSDCAPACLTVSGPDNCEQGANGRVRKLSVVSPPLSPVSPRDKQNVQWLPNNTQIVSLKNSSSDLIMRCFTPVEILPIYPIPSIDTLPVCTSPAIEPAKFRPSPDLSRGPSAAVGSPAMTNGLEGDHSGSPSGDIPAENRVTCDVEVHRQKSANSSTTDIHGHTETTV